MSSVIEFRSLQSTNISYIYKSQLTTIDVFASIWDISYENTIKTYCVTLLNRKKEGKETTYMHIKDASIKETVDYALVHLENYESYYINPEYFRNLGTKLKLDKVDDKWKDTVKNYLSRYLCKKLDFSYISLEDIVDLRKDETKTKNSVFNSFCCKLSVLITVAALVSFVISKTL